MRDFIYILAIIFYFVIIWGVLSDIGNLNNKVKELETFQRRTICEKHNGDYFYIDNSCSVWNGKTSYPFKYYWQDNVFVLENNKVLN